MSTTPHEGGNFPWAGQADADACTIALENLVSRLPEALSSEGKVHAESLMAAAGVAAGVAAQVSLLADADALARARANNELMDAQLTDGRVMLFGDPLNHMLFTNDASLARSRVWNMLLAAAKAKGMPDDLIPDIEDMFRHVSHSLGTGREGFPSTPPDRQPLLPAQGLLQMVSPVILDCLSGDPGAAGARPAETSWVAVTAQAAAQFLFASAQVVPPAISISIAMESAIYGSKLRPDPALQA